MKYAVHQWIGARDLQEDFCGVRHEAVLHFLQGDVGVYGATRDSISCVLADGMGGHDAGEIASRLVGEGFLAAVGFLEPIESAFGQLKQSVFSLNEQVKRYLKLHPELNGMGTTIVGIRIDRRVLRWVSVGDSHLYLIRKSKLHKLNDDHSMKPAIDEMIRQGIISEYDGQNHPDRHALRSAIFGGDLNLIDVEEKGISLKNGDVILVASDGLDSLHENTISKLVNRWRFFHPRWIVGCLLKAIKKVNSPSQDNVSIIAITI